MQEHDIRTDKRYGIAREFAGYPTKRWIVRFCGEWVATAGTKVAAMAQATKHHEELVAGYRIAA